MRNTRRHSVAAVAALSVLLAAPVAMAQEFGRGAGPRWGRGKGHGFGPRMAAALKLTDQQKAEIRQLRERMKEDSKPIREQLGERRKELHQLWMADRPNAETIIRKHAEMDPLRAELRARRVRFKLAVRDLLTAEQLDRFKEMKAKRGKGRRGRGFGPDCGPGEWCGAGPDADFGPQ